MKQRHFLILLPIICLIMSLLPVTAAAQAKNTEDLEQAIIDSCTYDQNVDIAQYGLTEQALEELFYSLEASGRLPWYAGDTFSYYYDEYTGLVLEFEPEPLDEASFDRTLYEQRVAEVLEECVLEGMNQWQIALSLHDYLVANTIYDESLTIRTGYDLLIKGTTVCSGYAALYQDLMNRAGIPCISVTSEPMEHVWNLVCIDGQWYHVDVTWDDPSPDTYGLVSHKYFLVTDAEISAGDDPHYDWETDITCTDSRFSEAYWRDVCSRICFTSSQTCYLLRENDWTNCIYRRDESTGEETVLYEDEESYVDIGYGNYTYEHRGLSCWNGRLYFCTLDQVLSMNPDGSGVRSEYRYDIRGNSKFLHSCFVTKDTAYLTVADHEGNTSPFTVKLADSGYHVHSYTETLHTPTCLEPGFTVSVCACGITCRSDVTAPKGHTWQQRDTKAATFFSVGFSDEECTECGHTATRELPRINLLKWLRENHTIVIAVIAVVSSLISASARSRKKKVQF